MIGKPVRAASNLPEIIVPGAADHLYRQVLDHQSDRRFGPFCIELGYQATGRRFDAVDRIAELTLDLAFRHPPLQLGDLRLEGIDLLAQSGGLIGFVGLVVPHVARWWVGPLHARLAPVVALGGAVLLVGVDTVARSALAPSEIPLGLLTALLGGPFFLYLLMRGGR